MVDPGKVESGRTIIIEGQYGTYVSKRVPDPAREGEDTDQIDPGEPGERPVTPQGE